LKNFDGIAGLIGIELTRFDQKLIDESAKPIGGDFPKYVAVYLVFDCHNSAPNLVMLYGTFRG
jgi:hypothetical protein